MKYEQIERLLKWSESRGILKLTDASQRNLADTELKEFLEAKTSDEKADELCDIIVCLLNELFIVMWEPADCLDIIHCNILQLIRASAKDETEAIKRNLIKLDTESIGAAWALGVRSGYDMEESFNKCLDKIESRKGYVFKRDGYDKWVKVADMTPDELKIYEGSCGAI